jgi:hypothetical protein
MNKFADYNRKPTPPKLPMPRCIYCASKAKFGCHDCGAPMCKRHATVEGNTLKCRAHKKKLDGILVTKGVLG